ncbi:MAG: hypothetical protein JF606_25385 [Burkholderiales bacterium]|nr:hypothetical protein [Burkholderiales bacterium]
MAKDNPPQQFQPLSYLPLVRSISEGQLADLRNLRRKLAGARAQPHVFDDATIDRVIRVHTESLGFLPYTRRQLNHWDGARPSASEREAIQRIRVKTDETEQLVREVLTLAQEIKAGTIDKVLATDDFELGWSALIKTLPNQTAQSAARTDSSVDADPEQLADWIDARVTELAAAGLDDKAIFEAMAVNHMTAIKHLLADDNLLDLCSRRPSLARYVGIVEDVMHRLLSEATQKLASYPNP